MSRNISTSILIAELSLTNPRDALHHGKRPYWSLLSVCFTVSLESTPFISSSTSFWYQFLHFRLTNSFTPITSSSSASPLCSSNITPSFFHFRLKTYLFHKSFHFFLPGCLHASQTCPSAWWLVWILAWGSYRRCNYQRVLCTARRILGWIFEKHGQHVSSERHWKPCSDDQRWIQQQRATPAHRHDDDWSTLRGRDGLASSTRVRASTQRYVLLGHGNASALGDEAAETLTLFERRRSPTTEIIWRWASPGTIFRSVVH